MNTDSIANRDEAIPVIQVTSHDSKRAPSPSPSGRSRISHFRSRSQGRFEDMSSRVGNKVFEKLQDKRSESPNPGSIQDKLMNLLLSQVIPAEGSDDQEPVDRRSRKYVGVERPNFSIPAMSNNFRRFNARIGPVFVFQNRVIRLFTWRNPSHTLSFLAVYSFVCLDPHLIVVLPLALCLFFIMVPAFLARHPPPPTTLPSELYPLSGPPLAPATKIKPAPDLSKDFFRNMRDLQNCMDDFSKAHDEVLRRLLPPTNFSNEAFSSTIFITLFFTSLILFVTAQLIPWRFLFLAAGWIGLASNHPFIQDLLMTDANQKEFIKQETEMQSQIHAFAEADIILDPAPEKREVEIFELQHRNPYDKDAEWEVWVFTPQPYDPMSPSMIAGDRPKGTRFFEDVAPPRGWKWADKKWTLDLLSREWVEERCITGVEVEVEGERWVSDLAYEHHFEDEEDVASMRSGKSGKSSKTSVGETPKRRKTVVTWEEGDGRHKLGEWRRRRWVRVVERIAVEASAKDDGRSVANE